MGIGGEDLTIVRSGLEIYNLNAQQLIRSGKITVTADSTFMKYTQIALSIAVGDTALPCPYLCCVPH